MMASMFNPFRALSITRSLSGIYRELRQIRRLAELVLDHYGVDRQPSVWRRLTDVVQPDTPDAPPFDEATAVREATEKLVQDIAEGRVPDTEYRPW